MGNLYSITYSTSSHTGKSITNLFDESDINKYSGKGDNSITYVSRNDWSGTFPTSAAVLTLTDAMKNDLVSNKAIVENGETMPTYGKDNGLTLAELRSSEDNPSPMMMRNTMIFSIRCHTRIKVSSLLLDSSLHRR